MKKKTTIVVITFLAIAVLVFISYFDFYFETPIPKIPNLKKTEITTLLASVNTGRIEGTALLKKDTHEITVGEETWKVSVPQKTTMKFLLDFDNSSKITENIRLIPEIKFFQIIFSSPLTITSPQAVSLDLKKAIMGKLDKKISIEFNLALNATIKYFITYLFIPYKENSVLNFHKNIERIVSKLYIKYCILSLTPNATLSLDQNHVVLGKNNRIVLRNFSMIGKNIEGALEIETQIAANTRIKINDKNTAINNANIHLVGKFKKSPSNFIFDLKTSPDTAIKSNLTISYAPITLELSDITFNIQGSVIPEFKIDGNFDLNVASMQGLSMGKLKELIENCTINIKSVGFSIENGGLNFDIPELRVSLPKKEIISFIKSNIEPKYSFTTKEFFDDGLLRFLLSLATLNIIDDDIGKMRCKLSVWDFKNMKIGFSKNRITLKDKIKVRVGLEAYYLYKIDPKWHCKKVWKVKVCNPFPTLHKRYKWGFAARETKDVDVAGRAEVNIKGLNGVLTNIAVEIKTVPEYINIKNFPEWAEKHIKPDGKSVHDKIKELVTIKETYKPFSKITDTFLKSVLIKDASFAPKGDNLVFFIKLSTAK